MSLSSRGSLKAIFSSAVVTVSTPNVEAHPEGVDDSVHQHLRRRGAGGDAEPDDTVEIGPVDLAGALHQHGARAAGALGHLDEAERVRAVGRADDDHAVAFWRDSLHRVLAVRGGVANIVLARDAEGRKARLQHAQDFLGVVHRQRGLGDHGEPVRVLGREAHAHRPPSRSDAPRPAAVGRWCRSTSGWPAWPISKISRPPSNSRSASICTLETSGQVASSTNMRRFRAACRHRLRHPMGGKHDGRVGLRDFVQFFDEDGALGLEGIHHVAVVDDGVADIDRRAIFLERQFDDLDRPVDARAESAWASEKDGQRRTVAMPPIGVVHAGHRCSRNGHFRGREGLKSCLVGPSGGG